MNRTFTSKEVEEIIADTYMTVAGSHNDYNHDCEFYKDAAAEYAKNEIKILTKPFEDEPTIVDALLIGRSFTHKIRPDGNIYTIERGENENNLNIKWIDPVKGSQISSYFKSDVLAWINEGTWNLKK